jgi:hypothetical protein
MMAVNNVGTVGVANNNTGGGVNNNNNNNRQPMPFNPSKNPKNNPMRINVNNDSKNNNNFNKFNRNNNKNNESQQRNVAAPIGGSIGNNMMGNVKNDKPPLPGTSCFKTCNFYKISIALPHTFLEMFIFIIKFV